MLGACGLLVAAGVGCSSSTPVRPAEAAVDHRIFAFPDWCGARVARRSWTDWDRARRRSPTGEGLCGVRAPDDTEICVVLRDHRVLSLEIADPRGVRLALAPPPGDARLGAWQVDGAAGPLLVRLRDGVLVSESAGGSSDGPCFSW